MTGLLFCLNIRSDHIFLFLLGFLHFHSHLSNLLYQLVEFHASSQYCLGNIALESKLQSPGKLLEATLWECANLAEEDSASYHKVHTFLY